MPVSIYAATFGLVPIDAPDHRTPRPDTLAIAHRVDLGTGNIHHDDLAGSVIGDPARTLQREAQLIDASFDRNIHRGERGSAGHAICSQRMPFLKGTHTLGKRGIELLISGIGRWRQITGNDQMPAQRRHPRIPITLAQDRPEVLIQPSLGAVRFMAFDRADEIVEAGYRAARQAIEDAAPLLWPA